MTTVRPPSHHDLSVEGIQGTPSLWLAFHHQKVSFRMRRLEPMLVYSIAMWTAWAGLLLNASDPVVWLVALYAALIGNWCRMFPAHLQRLMLIRGCLLLCGVFMLLASAGTGELTGPYFIWPVMVVAVYALLLAERWAQILSVLATAQFAAACVLAGSLTSWRLALVQAGVLWFFSFVAILFGRSMRQLDEQAELSHLDRNTHLYNREGFLAHGTQLFDDCRRAKRPFSLVLLNSADLNDVSDLVGKNAANQLFAQLVQHIVEVTPREGLAARSDVAEFALVLPGTGAQKAAALVRRHLGEPPQLDFMARGSKVTIMLDSLIAQATDDVHTLEDMYDRLHGKLLKRFGTEIPVPVEQDTTLKGLLDRDFVVPHNARPTVPMGLNKAVR